MPTITKGKSVENGKTVLHVEMTANPKPCPSCSSSDIVGFGRRKQSVADLPDCGKPVVLQIVTRRFRCKNCGRSFYESIEGVGSNRRMTDKLADWIRSEAHSRRFIEIAAESGLSEGTVNCFEPAGTTNAENGNSIVVCPTCGLCPLGEKSRTPLARRAVDRCDAFEDNAPLVLPLRPVA